MEAAGRLTDAKRTAYRASLDRVRRMVTRHEHPDSPGEEALLKISRWLVSQW